MWKDEKRTGGGNFHIHSLRKHSFYPNSFLIWVEHHRDCYNSGVG